MKEDLLYFIWKFKLFEDYVLFNMESQDFEILSQGEQNTNAGPDFIGARFKTKEATWIGNVEIHIKSSDWDAHKHQLDKAFNSVVLQIVTKHDKEVYTENGRLLPVMEIKLDENLVKKYHEYRQNALWIPCQADLHMVNNFKLKIWLGSVLIERLNRKVKQISELLALNKNSWEETFYQLLARSFGFKLNAEPFEWLAKSVPLKILAKHKNNLLHLEAILFGQAGFLGEKQFETDYFLALKKEYDFFKKKYQLKPIESHLWKFLRLRPSNFPYIRISQFALLIYKSSSLFSKILNFRELSEIEKMFEIQASKFWDTHYTFDKESEAKEKRFGALSIDSILINTVIPLLFVYGKYTDNEEIKERSISFLEKIKPEKNSITRGWQNNGIEVSSGFYSQALTEQKNNYCTTVQCLKCGIGIEIFKKQTKKTE